MAKTNTSIITLVLLWVVMMSCQNIKKEHKSSSEQTTQKKVTAKDILGNPKYLAMSYGGYREKNREAQPSITELKDDMKILSAMGIKIIRTYNVQLKQASNLLKAISELKKEDSNFEMHLMLGAWIDCKNAWTEQAPNHEIESQANAEEIKRAVALAKQYPDIVKIITVGNEAMVHWAESYFVRPKVILKWVNHLQHLKQSGELPESLWITSSDDFSSWGGGDKIYHTEDLNKLIKAVDYVSMHTYPFHNTHYNPEFWRISKEESDLKDGIKINAAMQSAKLFAVNQYKAVKKYVHSIDADKPVHIGETGWATASKGFYGAHGSNAADQFKSGLYYKSIRNWTKENNISCFYFEAFDEQWKDAENPLGSENHFGLINLNGQAKYALWDLVDQGIFKGLSRNGKPITKTFNGDKEKLMETVTIPPVKS